MIEFPLGQLQKLELCLQHHAFHIADIQRAVLRHLRKAHGAVFLGGIVAKQLSVQGLGHPCAAVHGNKGAAGIQAFLMNTLGNHRLAAAGFSRQENRGVEFCHLLCGFHQLKHLLTAADNAVKCIFGHISPLEQLPAQLTVHFHDLPVLLEGQQNTPGFLLNPDGGNIHHHRFVADVDHQCIGFQPELQRVLQQLSIQIRNGIHRLAAHELRGLLVQQHGSRTVQALDFTVTADLDNAAEGIVQHGLHFRQIALFQVNGVAHPGGRFQCIFQAFRAGRQEPVGQIQRPGALADDLAANYAAAAFLHGLADRTRELLLAVDKVASEVNSEQLVIMGGVSDHIREANQAKAGAFLPKLPAQIQHLHAQFLGGNLNLHHRQGGVAFDQSGLDAPGNDQITLLLHLQRPGDGKLGFHKINAGKGYAVIIRHQGCRQFAHGFLRKQNRNLRHTDTSRIYLCPV